MIRCNSGIRRLVGAVDSSHRRITAVAVAAVVVLGAVVVVPHRTYAMATTTTTTTTGTVVTQLSDSLQQSLPQLYDTPLKRIMSYDTDPITQSVTATVDTDDDVSTTLRNVVVTATETTGSSTLLRQSPLPSVCFVVRRPG